MPKKLPRSHVPPQPDEHPQSKHSDDGSSFVDQPHADPFETEPDSMGFFLIYTTHPTLFPTGDSNIISLTDAPTPKGQQVKGSNATRASHELVYLAWSLIICLMRSPTQVAGC